MNQAKATRLTLTRTLTIGLGLAACGGEEPAAAPGGSGGTSQTAATAGTGNSDSASRGGAAGSTSAMGAAGNAQGGSVGAPEAPQLNLEAVVDFPAGVTVASPVNRGGPSAGGPTGGGMLGRLTWLADDPAPLPAPPPQSPDGPPIMMGPSDPQGYFQSAAAIGAVLAGTSGLGEAFRPDRFFNNGGNAPCYGPSLAWANHPDAHEIDPATGLFPGGDLGIWQASTADGEACAAAQLNSRMRDVEGRVTMGLLGLAGLVAAYQANGATWPDDINPGESVDLLTELEAAGVDRTSFTQASLGLGSDGNTWTYSLSFRFTPNMGNAKSVALMLQHVVTDRDQGLFEGLLTYRIEDTYPDRNCRDRPNGDITTNGSVHYIKGEPTRMRLQARSGTACGHATTVPAADLLTEPLASTTLLGAVVNPDGAWGDNFNVFTGDFDPESQLGSYTYAWQAGSGDSHTRVLAVGLSAGGTGEAYFGFGDAVQTSVDGAILGFICNWAGPGNQHMSASFSRYAQHQTLTLDSSGQRYVVSSPSSSHITYAPTNSCMYDGSGTFAYDRNLDGSLGDESNESNAIMQADTTLPFDLLTATESEASVWDHILSAGFALPLYP